MQRAISAHTASSRSRGSGRLPCPALAHGSPEMILRYSSSVNARVVSVRTLP